MSSAGRSPQRDAQRLLEAAIEREAQAHRRLIAGETEAARGELVEASQLYRRSWELAPPRAFGRLVGALKAALLAGAGAQEQAAFVRAELAGADSPASAYALAIAALVVADDEGARDAAATMAEGDDAFRRAAAAIAALADRDPDRYEEALAAIVADFERRSEHLTGVAIADTALMLERIAESRGMALHPDSPVLPRG